MLRTLFGILVVWACLSCNPKEPYQPECCVKLAESDSGMVVSAHPLATDVGIAVLEKGGNAFDAAIAVQFALTVVYPRAGNIAGGGFMLARDSNGEVSSLDFRETAPSLAHRDMYLDGTGEPQSDLSRFSGLSVGIPGTIAGMQEIHKKFGSLDWETLLEIPILMAAKGIHLTAGEAGIINEYLSCILEQSSSAGPFHAAQTWKAGDLLVQPELAKTLQTIAEKGAAAFYTGALANSIVEGVKVSGGIISTEDLANYRAVWRAPAKIDFMDYSIYTMNMPSSGGLALSQMLQMLEMLRIDTTSFQSIDAARKMIEVSRIAYADRSLYPGDPDFVDVPFESLTNLAYLESRLEMVKWDTAMSSSEFQPGNVLQESEETTHFTVSDQWGNVVAITTTLNSNFGSCVYLPKLGIFLNNEMDDFSMKPGVPNQFGLIGAEANKIEPGKRMLSSMSPTIVEKNGAFFASIGTPGGATIITSFMQVFLNAAIYHMPPEQAVQAPRFHYQWLPDTVRLEAGALAHSYDTLISLGYHLRERDAIGKVEAIFAGEQNRYIGVADIRGEDHARGLP